MAGGILVRTHGTGEQRGGGFLPTAAGSGVCVGFGVGEQAGGVPDDAFGAQDGEIGLSAVF
ncbi:hypothetical protein [Streptomyces sp. NPDC017988]|uniref:hypothetical protein n=1 Tax=Streptomyces sp. NPDC017988 TaxID=3365025 RepID=UPI00378C7951